MQVALEQLFQVRCPASLGGGQVVGAVRLLAPRVNHPEDKKHLVYKLRSDLVTQGYWMKVPLVERLSDDAPVGAVYRIRSKDGKERLLVKVANLPTALRHIAAFQTRSAWYSHEEYLIDVGKHGHAIPFPQRLAHGMLQDPFREGRVIQENAFPFALRFYCPVPQLSKSLSRVDPSRYGYVVIYLDLTQGPHDHNFIKTAHVRSRRQLERAIMQGRRILWPRQ
jgi:hypothetical protein